MRQPAGKKTVAVPANVLSIEKVEELLIYFSTSINDLNTEEEIAWDLVKNCIARMNFTDCVIYFVDRRKKVLVQKAAHGPKNPRDYHIAKPIEIPLGKGISGYVAVSGIPEIITNTATDPRYIVDDEKRLSEVTVPIIIDNEVIGIIDCEHPEGNFFTPQHCRLLVAVASFCAIRISKLRTERREERERNKLIAAEKGMAKMRLQILNTQLGPHFLFNSISAIQYFLISDSKKIALNYLSLFSKLIRKFLGSLDKDKISVQEEVTMLQWYMQLQRLRYESRFQYQIEVDMSSSADDVQIPPFLVQSLAENFLEAMIPQNKGKSHIAINFSIHDSHVVILLSIEAQDGYFNSRVPEYREGFAQWSDHIEVYKKIKKYNITYHIDDAWVDDQLLVSKRVELRIPNLA
ncbi:MAG TPA: histidine kinase [Cyclobacteriaceae bacterium]|nr:histidine kinase [Cyclobacteriaceae bacterium]